MTPNSWKDFTAEDWQNATFCDTCGLPMLEVEDAPGVGHYMCVYCTWMEDHAVIEAGLREVRERTIESSERREMTTKEEREELLKAYEQSGLTPRYYEKLAIELAPDLAREVDRLTEILNGNARATVESMGFAGEFELFLKHPIVALFLLGWSEFWVESGAKNYLEMTMSDERAGDFTITIQRVEGKTPHQLKKEALEEVEKLRARLKSCEAALVSMVEQYCRDKNNEYSHDFMHAGEEAFDYLTRNGLAEWAEGENIALKEVKP